MMTLGDSRRDTAIGFMKHVARLAHGEEIHWAKIYFDLCYPARCYAIAKLLYVVAELLRSPTQQVLLKSRVIVRASLFRQPSHACLSRKRG
jgi:hypothetical protein